MSELTLDTAIKHCLDVAEARETEVLKYNYCRGIPDVEKVVSDCKECAADHRQLAEWLKELKNLREENKVLISECDRLIKEKGELLKKLEPITEYKRLLKAAVEDMTKEADCGICLHDNDSECPIKVAACKFKWRYADEALALIGQDGDTNG